MRPGELRLGVGLDDSVAEARLGRLGSQTKISRSAFIGSRDSTMCRPPQIPLYTIRYLRNRLGTGSPLPGNEDEPVESPQHRRPGLAERRLGTTIQGSLPLVQLWAAALPNRANVRIATRNGLKPGASRHDVQPLTDIAAGRHGAVGPVVVEVAGGVDQLVADVVICPAKTVPELRIIINQSVPGQGRHKIL